MPRPWADGANLMNAAFTKADRKAGAVKSAEAEARSTEARIDYGDNSEIL